MGPPELYPLPAAAMLRCGLARMTDGSPIAKAQRNFSDPHIHIMHSDGDHQVIVAIGVSNQPPPPIRGPLPTNIEEKGER